MTPPLMQELVGWLREESGIHPVLVAGIAQSQLVHIYPFVDGNGRTSGLLSALYLYRTGYDFKRLFMISEFYDRDRSRRRISKITPERAFRIGEITKQFSAAY